jgi:hypothetical protein
MLAAALLCGFAQAIDTPTAYNAGSVAGPFTCNTTVFVNSNAVAVGTINLVPDGQGNYISGTASYQLVAGSVVEAAALQLIGANSVATSYQLGGGGGVGCSYALNSGTYSVNPDGSGQSVTNWTLTSNNSSQGCAVSLPQVSGSFSIANASFSVSNGSRSESGSCTPGLIPPALSPAM